MAIKYTLEGLLAYMAIAAFLLAFLMSALGKKKTGLCTYLAGFMIAVALFVYRWHNVRHVPFQNMYEVFLAMGTTIYPLSIFCRRVLKVGGETIDMLIGAILFFPVGFIFHAEPQKLPPALQCWLFIPHVAVYLISYVIMTKASVQAICQLTKADEPRDGLVTFEEGTYRMVCLGFPLLSLGLILGSWWGKLAWGDYWGWDPKELWSLASWLVYVGYLHFRYMFGKKHAHINSLLVLLGLVVIVITLLWVNLSRIFAGLHNYTG